MPPGLLAIGLPAVVALATLVGAVDEPSGALSYIRDGGMVGVALLLVWAFLTKRIIPGRVHEDIVADRDRQLESCNNRENEWRALALNATGLNERQQVILERTVPTTPPAPNRSG